MKYYYYLILLTCASLIGCKSPYQPPHHTQESNNSPFDIASKGMEKDANYLQAIERLEESKSEFIGTNNSFMWIQAALTHNSFLQHNKLFTECLTQFYQPTDLHINSEIYDEDALSFLKEEIKKHTLVMINEQHWQPKHRHLGRLLLKTLYDAGFRYLAAEAIWEEDEALNRRKHPIQSTGFYTKEPVFGSFIRDALHMGFYVISYDDYSKDREYMQAKNIYEKTFAKDPNAKVFVWGGIAHIFENKQEHPRMGYYLKEMSGTNPLTIEQTSGDVKASALQEHYLAIDADTSRTHICDIYVYNNFKENDLQQNIGAEAKEISISLSKTVQKEIKREKKAVAMIYHKPEFDVHEFNAVPVLNYVLDSNKAPNINLQKGEYIILIRNINGDIIERKEISI